MIIIIKNKDYKNKSARILKQFETFYDTWLINKYIGGGIKT